MREKTVLPKTIEKYIQFLNELKSVSNSIDPISIEQIVKNYTINKSVIKPLQTLGIINRKSKYEWNWLADEPNKEMVLKILDFVLHKSKPLTQPPLLPQWATQITDLLKEISEKLTQPQTTEESSAWGFKTGDMRFELIKAIASGKYQNNFLYEDIEKVNAFIIKSADNLLEQLNSK